LEHPLKPPSAAGEIFGPFDQSRQLPAGTEHTHQSFTRLSRIYLTENFLLTEAQSR
jgi:hypothetical protein